MGGVRKRLSAEVEEVGFDGPDSIAIYLDGEEISRTCIVENPKAEARQLLATYQRVLEAGIKAEREACAQLCDEGLLVDARVSTEFENGWKSACEANAKDIRARSERSE